MLNITIQCETTSSLMNDYKWDTHMLQVLCYQKVFHTIHSFSNGDQQSQKWKKRKKKKKRKSSKKKLTLQPTNIAHTRIAACPNQNLCMYKHLNKQLLWWKLYLRPRACRKFCIFPIRRAKSNKPRPIMPIVKRTSQRK